MFFLNCLNGGAWPLLVGGVICLVDSVNGRDPGCPIEVRNEFADSNPALPASAGVGLSRSLLLCRIPGFSLGEILGNSRSVMLLNVLGDTRTTMSVRTRIPTIRTHLFQKRRGTTGITSTHLGPSIAIIGRATRNVS